MSKHELGDAPISEAYRKRMNNIAKILDMSFNPDLGERETGFVLMVFPFNRDGRMNYISNARREDVIIALREQLARFEGQPEMKGTSCLIYQRSIFRRKIQPI